VKAQLVGSIDNSGTFTTLNEMPLLESFCLLLA
jgi:hypothetical protein